MNMDSRFRGNDRQKNNPMMKSFGDILNNQSFNSSVLRTVQAAVVIQAAETVFKQFFGEAILDYAKPAYIQNKVLIVACLSSSAAQEIRLKEQDIIAYIKQKVPTVQLEKIRYLS
jgi:predicted nucleic acid-binding Zn ribbon protein